MRGRQIAGLIRGNFKIKYSSTVTTPGFIWGKLSTEGYGEVIIDYPKLAIYHELRAVIDIITVITVRAKKALFIYGVFQES